MWLEVNVFGDQAQLQWGNKAPHPKKYDIDLSRLRKTVLQVRACLAELTAPEVEHDAALRLQRLKALARTGCFLRRDLFRSVRQPDIAQALDLWVRGHKCGPGTPLLITSSPTIHIPWGLVYDGSAEAIDDLEDSPEAFSEFWCMKYALSSTLSGYGVSDETLNRNAAASRMLSLVNRYLAEDITANSMDMRATAFGVLLDRRPIGKAYTSKAMMKLVSGAGIGDTVFHFFCHHHDGTLDLGDETLDLNSFEDLLRCITAAGGGAARSYGLVIANACNSAFGDGDDSLLPVCEQSGFCGLIATETCVPNVTAADVYVRLHEALFARNRSVGEAMFELHHDRSLWPNSLLYGCYAQPDYRFASAA
jgi:hypothetical protein